METFESADAILDFAIEREQESYEFYTSLAGKVENSNTVAMFKTFAREELGHKEKLRKAKDRKQLAMAPGAVTDLKIGDYLVDIEPYPGMGYQEALILAMKKEKAAFRLYNDLSEIAGDEGIRSLFHMLALEEAKHKLRFELEYDEYVLKEN